MSRSVQQLLEFDRLREIVARSTTFSPGRRAIEALVFRQDREALENEFALIGEALAYLRLGSQLGFGSVADPDLWLPRLTVPTSVLTSGELLDAASLMEGVGGLKAALRTEPSSYPRLAERAAALGDFRSLLAAIRRAILPNGEISDDASAALKRIRAEMARTRDSIQHSLNSILRARGQPPGEDYITLRNERFVIPVRAAERRAVPGVVHAASATGQTVFVEPLETIDLNNRLVQLGEDEAAEIARILSEFTERLRLERGPLAFAAETAAHLDSVFARARYARQFDCALPRFSDGQRMVLRRARNPVLEDTLRSRGRAIVAITLELGGSDRIMVISGPNTGGKTVALKTAGLAALSAQCGIPVAAEEGELPVFDGVLADIGDEQSITADLSTFSAHMLNLRGMLESATARTLVLVDEMGTGTAPEEGAVLAVALLEEFRARRSWTIATTHHDRLKSYASNTPGVLNAAVEFDEVNLRPTYRLLAGVPGVSSGIEIARRLGLPAAVIERAKSELSPEAAEARGLIAYLHRSRDEIEALQRQVRDELLRLEQQRKALQTEWVERQRKRLAELEKAFADRLKQFESEVARLTSDIADRKLRAQLEKSAGRRLRSLAAAAHEDTDAAALEHLSAAQADLGVLPEFRRRGVAAQDLAPGARVLLRGIKQPVIVRGLEDRAAGVHVEVQAGALRMRVPLADIVAIDENPRESSPAAAAAASGAARGITVHTQPSQEASGEEINVIGCTVEEALRRVDKFLDSATLANLSRLRIVHGYGTGALQRALTEFLSGHPHVASLHAEPRERGGEGVTVVELKN